MTDTATLAAPVAQTRPLLDVRDLSVVYESSGTETVQAVTDVSFTLQQGEFVGLVGESGSGKSTLGFALTRLSKPPARLSGGSILFNGRDIATVEGEELRKQRHGGFAMVLQSGMNALNPVRSIRNHFVDIYRAHGHVARERWEARSTELVEKVELPKQVLDRYPGELSGGMRQRVSIALALSLEPQLLVSTSRPPRWTCWCSMLSWTRSSSFSTPRTSPRCSSATISASCSRPPSGCS